MGININVLKFTMKNQKFPEWYSKDLKSSIINKKIYHKKWKQSYSYKDCKKFSNIYVKCKKYATYYKNHIDNVQNYIDNNSKEFWKSVGTKALA